VVSFQPLIIAVQCIFVLYTASPPPVIKLAKMRLIAILLEMPDIE